MTKSATASHQGQWTTDFGERKIIPDNYHELAVDLQQKSGVQMRIAFRAYNEGAAFRYSFPAQPNSGSLVFTGERTEFRFIPDTWGYEEHGTEGEYQQGADRRHPAVVRTSAHVGIHEWLVRVAGGGRQ